jgi:hypothetical protein
MSDIAHIDFDFSVADQANRKWSYRRTVMVVTATSTILKGGADSRGDYRSAT